MSQQFSNNRFSLSIIDDCYYELLILNNAEITIDDIKEIVAVQKKMGAFVLPTLVSGTKHSITNTETLKYLSENKNFPYSAGGALVISSVSQRMLANFYLKLNKPQRPTQYFSSKEAAINWVKEFAPCSELV